MADSGRDAFRVLSARAFAAYPPGVGLIVGFMVFMFIAFVVAMSGNRSNPNLGGGSWSGTGGTDVWSLQSSGTPARGILMSVSSTGTRTNYRGQRFETRSARVDIEATGYEPFEVNTYLLIPSNLVRDVLPGSTVELRVNLSDRSQVLVIGPDVGFAQGAVKTT